MEPIVNDFSISIATVNGTGSQSANLILLQTLFDMGVPVSGKNLFPSNIAGLPTWYILRVSNQGYQAPGDRVHIQVMMNKTTWEKDLDNCLPGTVIIYNTDVKMPPPEKEGCIIYGTAMTKMARSINPKLARMIANMVYVGVLADLLSLDQAILEGAVAKQFNGKEKAISLNLQAINMAREWSAENIEKHLSQQH